MQEQPSSKHTPMHSNTIILFLVKAETSIFVSNGNISGQKNNPHPQGPLALSLNISLVNLNKNIFK